MSCLDHTVMGRLAAWTSTSSVAVGNRVPNGARTPSGPRELSISGGLA
jgi:hypothetical protein